MACAREPPNNGQSQSSLMFFCRVTYKQKYEQFKMVNVVIMLILGIVALVFSDVV